MGKYSHLKGSLETFQEEPTYQQRINEEQTKLKLSTKTPGELALGFHNAKLAKKRLEAQLKDANLTLAAYDQAILKHLEGQGLSQIRHETAGLLSIRDTPYVSIIDQQAMLHWVSETNRESLLTVNYQTMSGIVNRMLEAGEAPPKFVKVYMKSSMGQTGADKE